MTVTGIDGLLSGSKVADLASALRFSTEENQKLAFDHHFRTLDAAPSDQVDLDALRLCVRLLPSRTHEIASYERIEQFYLSRIIHIKDDTECLYLLAEICLSNHQLGHEVLRSVTKSILEKVAKARQNDTNGSDYSDDAELQTVVAYLGFLKASFWLPPTQLHYITSDLLESLLACIGVDGLDGYAHDALSALFHLLKLPGARTINPYALAFGSSYADHIRIHSDVDPKIFDDSLFIRYEELPAEYFSKNSGKAFRSWFQWIDHATANNIKLNTIKSPFYWSTLRKGLLDGFADQRRYCLGIIHQSVMLSDTDINTPYMNFKAENKSATASQYERYSTLFETVVLDRYVNQSQARLPEMSVLFGPQSLISPSWTTALLSAALSSKVQDGIRKLVGNWYINYIINETDSAVAHVDFFVEGFLPWATQGSLFTSTLTSSRITTQCAHGVNLANALTKLVLAIPQESSLLTDIFSYILETGGKIFAPAVLYLVEGILGGLKTRTFVLSATDANLILRVSRLPSLPEIAADLLTVYCKQLGDYVPPDLIQGPNVSSYDPLEARIAELERHPLTQRDGAHKTLNHFQTEEHQSLRAFKDDLVATKHKAIQYEAFGPACKKIISILDHVDKNSTEVDDLLEVLDAFWEEADRLEYHRSTVIHIPDVFFHPTCIHFCVQTKLDSSYTSPLITLLSKVLWKMQRLTEGRAYILPMLGTALRKACFLDPSIMAILPLDDFLVQFINNPPSPKREFLFEAVFGHKLQQYISHRDYEFYYGPREWHGYAAIIDLISRFPESQASVADRVLDRILEPWRTQKPPVPIVSKWKNVFQLQVMMLLVESCVNGSNFDHYLDGFMNALVVEHWPRHRFLLEWTITRIYYRDSTKTQSILHNLANLDENSPMHIASLMKLAMLVAPFVDSEEFTLQCVIQLIPFSASPKVQIRHEAHWLFPIAFGLAKERGWSTITDNPGFLALDKYIRSLDKFNTMPSTIRTLKFDAVQDFSLTNIFQGHYLSIETPELERVAQEDFQTLYKNDQTNLSTLHIPNSRIPLGSSPIQKLPPISSPPPNTDLPSSTPNNPQDPPPTFFQTKANFDLSSLLPPPGPPSSQNTRPASVILIASLIDNPTNLGGLSRISESFGLEALYIDDVRKTAHKDFKATSVTSEKHFPIHELKISAVPAFLTQLKTKGYEVVGIEQTDRSGMLGDEPKRLEGDDNGKGEVLGTLPRKCVLVLGSERGGISKEVLAAVDRCVEIRTVGVTRSLNVQTAGGIAVFEWWREWGGK
ncbi:unnamed protein product [Periconia digitata]|uniref:tRNA/rRNA methyltransferase SpoU type domain-containing protein n=1 Tax=Periconia digitata TaxID=1303443 RepID=A0A9W4UVV2_9PLEO|nr:unnamed protein product [Periconia digitata]